MDLTTPRPPLAYFGRDFDVEPTPPEPAPPLDAIAEAGDLLDRAERSNAKMTRYTAGDRTAGVAAADAALAQAAATFALAVEVRGLAALLADTAVPAAQAVIAWATPHARPSTD